MGVGEDAFIRKDHAAAGHFARGVLGPRADEVRLAERGMDLDDGIRNQILAVGRGRKDQQQEDNKCGSHERLGMGLRSIKPRRIQAAILHAPAGECQYFSGRFAARESWQRRGQRKTDLLLADRLQLDRTAEPPAEHIDALLDHRLRRAGPGRDQHRLVAVEPVQVDVVRAVDQVRRHVLRLAQLGQPPAVGAVVAADDQHTSAWSHQRPHRLLAVLRGVADVFLRRADDVRKPLLQLGDDLGRLVDRERRLREIGQPLGVVDLESRRRPRSSCTRRIASGASPIVPITSSCPSWPIRRIV